MKFFAYYLPQFHCIPENDEWWGKGFTEWTNVKKAKKLYKGHKQPKAPLNNNYYSLDKIETLKWQAELMEKYSIDGLIFYHYYFKGKKLLEKPSEMLLKNKSIPINFFFCWANHSWIRSWNGTKEILLEQTYGTKKDWNEHFEYLLPFFKDDRYQKKDNKPIFMIFKNDFVEKKEMFEFFDSKCKENGFDGICIIETVEKYLVAKQFKGNSSYECLLHLREPSSSLKYFRGRLVYLPKKIMDKMKSYLIKLKYPYIKKYDGNKLYKIMINKYIENKNIVKGLFFEWDNTPRHGRRGYVITSPSKEVFMKYMNTIKNEDYVFINAWNEWCEGMMLEPTVENKYKYLEWLKEWKNDNNRINGV